MRLELTDGEHVDETDPAQPAQRVPDRRRWLVEFRGDLVVRELLVLLEEHEDPSGEMRVVAHHLDQMPQPPHALRAARSTLRQPHAKAKAEQTGR